MRRRRQRRQKNEPTVNTSDDSGRARENVADNAHAILTAKPRARSSHAPRALETVMSRLFRKAQLESRHYLWAHGVFRLSPLDSVRSASRRSPFSSPSPFAAPRARSQRAVDTHLEQTNARRDGRKVGRVLSRESRVNLLIRRARRTDEHIVYVCVYVCDVCARRGLRVLASGRMRGGATSALPHVT